MPLTSLWMRIALGAMTGATAVQATDWQRLDAFHGQMTRGDLRWLLDSRYAPGDAWRPYIRLEAGEALIFTGEGSWEDDGETSFYRLKLREATAEPGPETTEVPLNTDGAGQVLWSNWRPELPPQGRPLRVALDPGHIGGAFGELEGRSWSVGGGPVFREGDEVLAVARLAAEDLRACGAEAVLVRGTPEPVTAEPLARYAGNERAWYVGAEIRARAERINGELYPDMVVALHFNAVSWPDPSAPSLVKENHAHLLVNGSYSVEELRAPDQRLAMLERLLSGVGSVEVALAEAFTPAIRATGLPPFAYGRRNAYRINADPYLWSRNLLANRLYRCPVVYLELFVANSQAFYRRWSEDPQAVRRDYARLVVQALQPWLPGNPAETANRD